MNQQKQHQQRAPYTRMASYGTVFVAGMAFMLGVLNKTPNVNADTPAPYTSQIITAFDSTTGRMEFEPSELESTCGILTKNNATAYRKLKTAYGSGDFPGYYNVLPNNQQEKTDISDCLEISDVK